MDPTNINLPTIDIDEELEVVRERILLEIAKIRREMELRQERLEALRTTLRGLNSLLSDEAEQPQGFEAIEIVAREAIERGNLRGEDGALTVTEITDELFERGWIPNSNNPESAVRASIRRLRVRDPRWGLLDGRLYYHDVALPSEDDEEEDA